MINTYGKTLSIDRKNILNTKIIDQSTAAELSDGQIELSIQSFALTANNVTYAITGDQIGYWKFFPLNHDQGIVPVWGFAVVSASKNTQIALGDRYYGFFPLAEKLIVEPDRITSIGFVDAAAHRKDLPAVYNHYSQVNDDEIAGLEPLQPLLMPLFATSWLIQDFLLDNEYFEAEQIIIGSVSSKTGYGLAKYLSENRPNCPKIVGLTSQGNAGFVESLNVCDHIVTYDKVEDEILLKKSVFVDMAGNTYVRRVLHFHLKDKMVYSCAVGMSHWDKFAPSGEMPGAKPQFFFAPSQIAKRHNDWGRGVVQTKINEAWARLAIESREWMNVVKSHGMESARDLFVEMANGKVSPKEGHFVSLSND